MFEFEKLCKSFESMSDDERLACLRGQVEIVYESFHKIAEEPLEILLAFLGTVCGVDGKLSGEEFRLFSEVSPVELDFFEAKTLVELLKPKENRETAQLVADLVGKLGEDERDALLMLCLCLCSADNRISIRERVFIKQLAETY